MDRRDRAALDDLHKRAALGIIQQGPLAGRLAIQQSIRAAGVKPHDPVPHNLKRDAAYLRCRAPPAAVVNLRQRLSIHRAGNGVDLVAGRPTPGSVDICFRWGGSIAEAVAFLRSNDIAIIDGPSARQTADKRPSASVYFRNPDGNLVELMAADWE